MDFYNPHNTEYKLLNSNVPGTDRKVEGDHLIMLPRKHYGGHVSAHCDSIFSLNIKQEAIFPAKGSRSQLLPSQKTGYGKEDNIHSNHMRKRPYLK